MRRFSLCFLIALVGAGCLDNTPPELAPEALDENLRWFWTHGDSATDASLIDAAAKLAVAGKADVIDKPLKGGLRKRLEAGDVAEFGLSGTDPSTARGMLLLNRFECSLDKLESILISQDQGGLYPDIYKTYSRSYTSDVDAFRAGTVDALSWNVAVKAAFPIEDVYTSSHRGGARRVRAPVDGPTKGNFILARSYLTAPASFVANSGNWLKQDYQIEIFWAPAPGQIFHAYGMWRDVKAVGLTIEDDGFLNFLLDNSVKWDNRTQELCKRP